MEGIFFRLVKYNDSIHPDQFRQKFPHENHQEPQGVDIKRLAHACVRMKGFANWAAIGFLFDTCFKAWNWNTLKYNNSLLVIEIWIAILCFFSHSAWYLSSSCWMLIAIDGYHEATSLDLQSLGYETKCLGWKHGDMGLMGLMGGGYGGLVVLWIW